MWPKRSRSSRKKKTSCEAEDGIDRLSGLLEIEPLIILIFSFLDMKDVVKTSVLSKRWKDTWTRVDSIAFNFGIDSPYVDQIMQFFSLLDYTSMALSRRDSCFNVKKFCISRKGPALGYMVEDLFQWNMPEYVDRWLRFVLRRNVEVLKLEFVGLNCLIPSCLYRSSSLVELSINQVGKAYFGSNRFVSLEELESEGENIFHYKKKFDVSLNRLKRLSLTRVYILQEFMEEMLSGCPVLETLVLESVMGFTKLNVTSPCLNELKLVAFVADFGYKNPVLEVTAPWVKNLEISGDFEVLVFHLVNVCSVKNAKFTHGYGISIIPWSNMTDELLVPVSHADELTLGAEQLQALSILRMTNRRPITFDCKYITIQSPICANEVLGIVCLLESSPNLETLVVRIIPYQPPRFFISSNSHVVNNLDAALKSFPGADYLSQRKNKFPCLKNVTIDCGETTKYTFNRSMCSFELEIVAYIIRNAQFLKKFVLSSSKTDFCEYIAAGFISLMSETGKAIHWEGKETNSTQEYIFHL